MKYIKEIEIYLSQIFISNFKYITFPPMKRPQNVFTKTLMLEDGTEVKLEERVEEVYWSMNLVLATFLIASHAIMLTWLLQKVTTPSLLPA